MNTKAILLMVLLIVVAGGFFLYNKTRESSNVETKNSAINSIASSTIAQHLTSAENKQAAPKPSPSTAPMHTSTPSSTTHFSAGEGDSLDGGVPIQVIEVDYDGNAFSPAATIINKNDYVFFKNKSAASFILEIINGYASFNTGIAIAPGNQYKFQFIKAGSWKYDDKRNPSAHGIVTVQ